MNGGGQQRLQQGAPVFFVENDIMYVVTGCSGIPVCTCGSCSSLKPHIDNSNLVFVITTIQKIISLIETVPTELINRPENKVDPATFIRNFLRTSLPYLVRLEAIARSIPRDSKSSRKVCKMLGLTQHMSCKLEHMLLLCASKNLISLDETDPSSLSPFCIGWYTFKQLKITTFRYCTLTPYLAQSHSGLYKRMRWNVDLLLHKQRDLKGDEEMIGETEQYFLCYEAWPNDLTILSHSVDTAHHCFVGTWSIGYWEPAGPLREAQISDWVLCETPVGKYRKIVHLGPEEPLIVTATNYLEKVLIMRYYSHKLEPRRKGADFAATSGFC